MWTSTAPSVHSRCTLWSIRGAHSRTLGEQAPASPCGEDTLGGGMEHRRVPLHTARSRRSNTVGLHSFSHRTHEDASQVCLLVYFKRSECVALAAYQKDLERAVIGGRP